MDREVLFRGFSEESREWVYGDLINGLNAFLIGYYVDVPPTCNEPGGDIKRIHDEVIPDSVGQFTGLTDKNGKKIFEGDIVENHTTRTVFNADIRKYESISNTTRFCVVFDSKWGCFKFTEESERGVFAVIGNIFENPELLEPENKKAA